MKKLKYEKIWVKKDKKCQNMNLSTRITVL
jgi:hypothetical protein